MPHPDTSPTIHTQWLIDAALKRGIEHAEMRQLLAADNEGDPNWATLPIDSYLRLFNWLAKRCGDSRLGLHLGEETDISTFGGSAYMIYHTATLRDCLKCLSSYDQTISQGISITFSEGNYQSCVEYSVVHKSGDEVIQDVEMTVSMLLRFCREHLGDQWMPQKIHFNHAAPQQLDEHHRLLGKDVFFDQPVNSIWFDTDELNTGVTTADPYLLEVLRDHTDQLQETILRQNDLLAQVKYFIARTMGSEDCTANIAAEQLYMSRRSLTRHLKNQDTTFRNLKNEIIKEVAQKALAETSVSINEIASRLGYSETSAFDRAFKGLTGCSPVRYRQRFSP